MGHQEKRAALLAAVEAVRETVTQHADEAEAIGTLPQATVDALVTSGLFALKLPTAFGGAEADPVTQIEVIEALSAIEPSAAWCTMIGATAIGLPAAFLPEESIAQIFPGGHIPSAAIIAMPAGQAVPSNGGYRVSGRWPFVSGVRHAQWITAGARLAGADHASVERRMLVFPAAAAQIHDNWQVAGLQGTGSCDISLTEYFVPQAFTWDPLRAQPRRGGPLYRLALPGFVANEHAAFALGVGRSALETLMGQAQSKRRGALLSPSSLASRPTFQRAVGVCDLRLRAARALVLEIFTEAWTTLRAERVPSWRLQAEMRSVAAFATEVALDVTTQAFRYGGGAAVYRTQRLQRCLRDLNVAAQHYMVSDIVYETHGQYALGLPDVDPAR
jgi:indole-3-acetate monooxygenase